MIIVSVDEAPDSHMQTAYRLPKTPLPPGVTPKPAELLSITWMNVKSLITWPRAEASCRLAVTRSAVSPGLVRAMSLPSISPLIVSLFGVRPN